MEQIRILWDGTPDDLERIKSENSLLILREIQNHEDGDFLVFSNMAQEHNYAAPMNAAQSSALKAGNIVSKLKSFLRLRSA